MAQTNINMLNVNKQGFRSLKSEEMKKLMGGAGVSGGCPTGACVFRGSYCQIVTGTCSGTAGDCRCTGGTGNKVEVSAGCSATLNGPGGLSAVCVEENANVGSIGF
jgi:hypothetical protein